MKGDEVFLVQIADRFRSSSSSIQYNSWVNKSESKQEALETIQYDPHIYKIVLTLLRK